MFKKMILIVLALLLFAPKVMFGNDLDDVYMRIKSNLSFSDDCIKLRKHAIISMVSVRTV